MKSKLSLHTLEGLGQISQLPHAQVSFFMKQSHYSSRNLHQDLLLVFLKEADNLRPETSHKKELGVLKARKPTYTPAECGFPADSQGRDARTSLKEKGWQH